MPTWDDLDLPTDDNTSVDDELLTLANNAYANRPDQSTTPEAFCHAFGSGFLALTESMELKSRWMAVRARFLRVHGASILR